MALKKTGTAKLVVGPFEAVSLANFQALSEIGKKKTMQAQKEKGTVVGNAGFQLNLLR